MSNKNMIILNLLSDRNRIQDELNTIKTSLKFDSSTVFKRTSLMRQLFDNQSSLSIYSQYDVINAIENKERIERIKSEYFRKDNNIEYKKKDNFYLLLIALYLYLSEKNDSKKMFLLIGLTNFLGDSNEPKLQ